MNINNITEDQLIIEYNNLRSDCLSKPNIPAKQYLTGLNDFQLAVFIAGRTYEYGRPFQDCINNALSHLEDKERAIKSFSSKDKERGLY